MKTKKKILICVDWYEPGFKAGGPIQSCKNIVAALGNLYEFYILTSDRDANETKPYENVVLNEWVPLNGHTQVWYASPGTVGIKKIQNLVRSVNPDIVYFNSMFSRNFTLLPLLALKYMRFTGKVVLAPRGMLHEGALQSKSLKKKIFLQIFRLTGWSSGLLFHATDELEMQNVTTYFPSARVKVAGNIPNVDNSLLELPEKKKNELDVVFISRVHPHKNLRFLLEIFRELDAEQQLHFDIYGVEEDPAYAAECKELAASMPGNINVNFKGPLASHKVPETLKRYQAFVLPTKGENFGHAIFESLIAGRPVLISDLTPWKELSTVKAGWDLPLADKQAFLKAVNVLLEMDQKEYNEWATGAKKHAQDFLLKQDYISTYSNLFDE